MVKFKCEKSFSLCNKFFYTLLTSQNLKFSMSQLLYEKNKGGRGGRGKKEKESGKKNSFSFYTDISPMSVSIQFMRTVTTRNQFTKNQK